MKQYSAEEIALMTRGSEVSHGSTQGEPLAMYWRVPGRNTFDINGYELTTDSGEPMEFCNGYLRSAMICGTFPYRALGQEVVFTRRPSRSGGAGHVFFDLYFADNKGTVRSGCLASELILTIKGREIRITGQIIIDTESGTLARANLAAPFRFCNNQFTFDLEVGDSIGFYPDGTVQDFSFSRERFLKAKHEGHSFAYFGNKWGASMNLQRRVSFHRNGDLKKDHS
ncbi:MAG: hypothetical protein PQJ60_00280 [Spirochaetales bacterium]|nr:hypothetical protein [Spirochaetales bacterium]